MNRFIVLAGLALGVYYLVRLEKKLYKLEIKTEEARCRAADVAVDLQILEEETQVNTAIIYSKFKKLMGEEDT